MNNVLGQLICQWFHVDTSSTNTDVVASNGTLLIMVSKQVPVQINESGFLMNGQSTWIKVRQVLLDIGSWNTTDLSIWVSWQYWLTCVSTRSFKFHMDGANH